MMTTLLRIRWLNLKRDRVALALTFVLPLVFFSIFALIFGGVGNSASNAVASIPLIAVDLDGSEVSAKLIDALADQQALEVVSAPEATESTPEPEPYDRGSALQAVQTGKRSVAIVVPKGFAAEFGNFAGDPPSIELIYDPSNPLARHTVAGLIQASAFTSAPEFLLDTGIEQFETLGGKLTPEQKKLVQGFKSLLSANDTAGGGKDAAGSSFAGLVQVEAVSAMQDETEDTTESRSIVSYYAAGIGVIFLLFSMTGAAAVLLEEEESGTLERLLSSRVDMGTLLAGNWIFFSLVGVVQLTVMFLWGALAFGLDLFTTKHFAGFACMSLLTAGAAAALGLMLATVAKSRAQLNGISTVVVLVMSAVGGSMIPRFVMPEFMKTAGLFTFNGWALDGYLKVFWYEDPAATLAQSLFYLAPQLAMLAAMTAVFLAVARTLARRWEAI